MSRNKFVALATVVGLMAAATVRAEESEREGSHLVRPAAYQPDVRRPSALPALYASLGAMHVWDVYSTRAALKAGAREANPAATRLAGSPSSLIGLKAATTASTIFFAERMWKKNKVGAIVMLVAVNGATAAVSMQNMRNAKKLSMR